MLLIRIQCCCDKSMDFMAKYFLAGKRESLIAINYNLVYYVLSLPSFCFDYIFRVKMFFPVPRKLV